MEILESICGFILGGRYRCQRELARGFGANQKRLTRCARGFWLADSDLHSLRCCGLASSTRCQRLGTRRELVHGCFFRRVMLSEFGNELEEWVLTTREYLAGRVVEAHLRLAEQALGHDDLENVKRHANQAHKLPGAPPLEEDTLTRLHSILNAIKSPSAAELRREAAELGLELSTASHSATVAPAPTNLPHQPAVLSLEKPNAVICSRR